MRGAVDFGKGRRWARIAAGIAVLAGALWLWQRPEPDLIARSERVWLPPSTGGPVDSAASEAVWASGHELITITYPPDGPSIARIDTQARTVTPLPAASAALASMWTPRGSPQVSLLHGGRWVWVWQYHNAASGGLGRPATDTWAIHVADGHITPLPFGATTNGQKPQPWPHDPDRIWVVAQGLSAARFDAYRLDVRSKRPERSVKAGLSGLQGWCRSHGMLSDCSMVLFREQRPIRGEGQPVLPWLADLWRGEATLSRLPLDVARGGYPENGAVSPDGKRLAWIVYRTPGQPAYGPQPSWLQKMMSRFRHVTRTDLWVAGLDGSGAHCLGHLDFDDRSRGWPIIGGLQWVPGGRYLSFSVSGRPELWRIPAQ